MNVFYEDNNDVTKCITLDVDDNVSDIFNKCEVDESCFKLVIKDESFISDDTSISNINISHDDKIMFVKSCVYGCNNDYNIAITNDHIDCFNTILTNMKFCKNDIEELLYDFKNHQSCIDRKIKSKSYMYVYQCVKDNNVQMLKYYHENGNDTHISHIKYYITNTTLDIIKYILDTCISLEPEITDGNYLIDAIDNETDTLEIVKCLINNNFYMGHKTTQKAVKNNNYEVLNYLISKNCPIKSPSTWSAVRRNNYNMLKYLHEVLNVELDKCCIQKAIFINNREIFYYLLDNGATCNNCYMNYTISGSYNIELVKYAIEHGGFLNKTDNILSTCNNAAFHGNFEVFKYLVEQGCEMTPHTMGTAIRENHFNIVKFIVENKHNYDHKNHKYPNILTRDYYRNTDTELLDYLEENGLDFPLYNDYPSSESEDVDTESESGNDS